MNVNVDYILLLTLAELQKEVTEAVKKTQGSKSKASWKASARPCWWINNYGVTLKKGTDVKTGTFDIDGRRAWRKSHYQAALFLYQKWKSGEPMPSESKEEAKVEDEIKEEPAVAPGKAKRRQKEESLLHEASPQVPRTRTRAIEANVIPKAVDAGKTASSHKSRKEREVDEKSPSRTPRNEKSIKTANISPNGFIKSPSQQESSQSAAETNGSPSPQILRKRVRRRAKEMKTSPKLESPIAKRLLRPRKARNGKAVVRGSPKPEITLKSIRRSPMGNKSEPNLESQSHIDSSNSDAENEGNGPRTRRRGDANATTTPRLQKHQRTSPHLANTVDDNNADSSSAVTRKRRLFDEDQDITKQHRKPLRERNEQSYKHNRRPRKKFRTSDTGGILSNKENQTPEKTKTAKPNTPRSTAERKAHSAETEADDTRVTETNEEAEEVEPEIVDEVAEQQRKELRIRFLRDQIAKVNATRRREEHLIDENTAEFEAECHYQKVQVVNGLRTKYSGQRFKFSKRILDMPISTFAREHGGSTDEWLIHDIEEGVNKTFEALHNGEDPRVFGMQPPKTPAAESRRAKLTKTARKTQRRVATEAAEAGLTVRRSKRDAARVATERTRAIISYTPRTTQQKVRIPEIGAPGPTGTAINRAKLRPEFGQVGLTRQKLGEIIETIRKAAAPGNREDVLHDFTSLIQEGVLEERSDQE